MVTSNFDEPEDPFVADLADRANSKEDFLEVLRLLTESEEDFDEFRERTAIDFLSVIHEKLASVRELPDSENIELPNSPSWNWLARLLVVGAFDN